MPMPIQMPIPSASTLLRETLLACRVTGRRVKRGIHECRNRGGTGEGSHQKPKGINVDKET